jgi:hypothetical protein
VNMVVYTWKAEATESPAQGQPREGKERGGKEGRKKRLSKMVHTCNPSTQKAEAGGFWVTRLSQKTKQNLKMCKISISKL